MIPHPRDIASILANAGLRALGILLVLAALAVPAYAYWQATQPPEKGMTPQIAVEVPAGEPASIGPIPDYPGKMIVLCYHDISPTSESDYTVRPRAFAKQMVALRAAGFHTIDAETFAAFAAGKHPALPSRPLLITFDDGTKGTWVYGDKILEQVGFEATSFLITHDVGRHQPYYLSWPEIEAMAASGRWSFGSHTHDGHGEIPSSDIGDEGPFLTNLEWLPRQRRLETMAEYEARVGGDLDHSIAMIQAHGLPRPQLFAYPFSAVEPTNNADVGPTLARLLAERFPATFDNRAEGTRLEPGVAQPLSRIEVFRKMPAEELLNRIRNSVLTDKIYPPGDPRLGD